VQFYSSTTVLRSIIKAVYLQTSSQYAFHACNFAEIYIGTVNGFMTLGTVSHDSHLDAERHAEITYEAPPSTMILLPVT